MTAKAVIFDCGNVLFRWDPDSLIQQFVDDETRLRFIEDVDLWRWHDSLDAGRPFDEAAAELSRKYPQYKELIFAWGERFGETVKEPVPGVHDLVRALYARAIPLFALTNFSADFWPEFHAREREFFDLFDDIIASGEVKLLKPDPAIFVLALDRFRLHPREAMFVDDRMINVEAAQAVGMRAHRFTTADDLRLRLEAEGLL